MSEANSKRQISIAESNLTSRDSSTSLSDASSLASRDDSLSPERAPTHTIHKSSPTHEVPMVAQGTATTSNSLRKSKLNSARSTNHRPDSQARDANLERRKMTTPYGHVLSKNGYIMVKNSSMSHLSCDPFICLGSVLWSPADWSIRDPRTDPIYVR